MSKVAMPEPVGEAVIVGKEKLVNWFNGCMPVSGTLLFTEAQMQAYAQARVNEALEEAAQIAANKSALVGPVISKKIRALKKEFI
jgi:hypothetical protein